MFTIFYCFTDEPLVRFCCLRDLLSTYFLFDSAARELESGGSGAATAREDFLKLEIGGLVVGGRAARYPRPNRRRYDKCENLIISSRLNHRKNTT